VTIRCTIAPDADLVFMGRLLAGLYDQPGTRVSLRAAAWITLPYSMALEIDGLKIGIELSDHADFWDADLLAWSDVYAKRSLNPAHIGAQPAKVIPLGLHCAGHSDRGIASLLVAIAASGAKLNKQRLRAFYRAFATAHWRDFERSPEQPVTQAILFQTRVWDAVDTPGDAAINEQRVALLRSLRQHFGKRLVGGLVGNEYAMKHFPELVTTHPTRQPQYIRWAKAPAIGIYSRGLFGSIAFKMAEFMASSKCVISEPVANLTPGVLPLSVYGSNDECVALCQDLLDGPELLAERRREAWRYYTEYVRPAALIANLLERARAKAQQRATT
jgi:hypothetical protein